MDFGIQGKKALVCASSRGLGKGVAKALAQEGVHLFLCATRSKDLEITAAELRQLGAPSVHTLQCDLTVHPSRQQLIQEVLRVFPDGIDILIHNVGGPAPTTVEATTLSMWHQALDRLLVSVAHLNHIFLPAMKKRQWGRIVTITSLAAMEPMPGMALSNSIRSAVMAMNKTLSKEVAPYCVTVNNVAPGFIYTDRIDELIEQEITHTGETRAQALERYEGRIPLRRLGTIDEFGSTVAFLCSQQGGYITGSTIAVDGGKRLAAY